MLGPALVLVLLLFIMENGGVLRVVVHDVDVLCDGVDDGDDLGVDAMVAVPEPGQLPPSHWELPLPDGVDGELLYIEIKPLAEPCRLTYLCTNAHVSVSFVHVCPFAGRGVCKPLPFRHLPPRLQVST